MKVVDHANYAGLELVLLAFLPLLLYLNSECFIVGNEMVVAQLIVKQTQNERQLKLCDAHSCIHALSFFCHHQL